MNYQFRQLLRHLCGILEMALKDPGPLSTGQNPGLLKTQDSRGFICLERKYITKQNDDRTE